MITVKPLVWKQTVIGDGTVLRQNAWQASHYQIIESPSGKYDLRGDTYAICNTLQEAQAAAFADYSARIMSAIEPAGVGVETQPWNNDTIWARFYRDGKTLGEICEEFKCGIYDLSPWLTAPLTRADLTKDDTHD